MIFLILCILMNVWIYLDFRLFHHFKVEPLQAIIVNYFVCVLTGSILIADFGTFSKLNHNLLWFAAGLGILFIVNFYVISLTTREFGVTTASVAGKLSLIIPILISVLFIPTHFKTPDLLNYIGIILAIPAVILSSLKKQQKKASLQKNILYFLPFLTFLFTGAIDSSINVANYFFLESSGQMAFPMIIFIFSSLIGLIYLVVKRIPVTGKHLLGGIALGIPNYFAVYFLLKSLTYFQNDGAIVYSSVNIGIIVLAGTASVLFFREKLSPANITGLVLSAIAILLIYHQEVFAALF